MLIFDPARQSRDPAFDRVLERLKTLVTDMEAIRDGCAPAKLAGEPPLLERWAVAQHPATCLTGHSTGHPLLPGVEREILTSDLHLLSSDRQWAPTASRWYRLGEPSEGVRSLVRRFAHAPAQAALEHVNAPRFHAFQPK